MKRFFWFSMLLILILVACSSDGTGFECREDMCISLEVEEPVKALEPALFTISVKTEKDVSGLGISIYGDHSITILDIEKKPDGAELTYQDDRSMDWRIDTKGGEEYIITGNVALAKPTVSYGVFSYGLIVAANHPSTIRVTDSINIYLDAEGNQLEESDAKLLMETDYPLPTPPPDMIVITRTPWPTIIWPTDTSLPTLTPTPPPYP